MSIDKRGDRYRVRVSIKGKKYSRTFNSLTEAKEWETFLKSNRNSISSIKHIDDAILTEYNTNSSIIKSHTNSKSTKVADRINDELCEVDRMSGRAFEDYCSILLSLCGLMNYASFSQTRTTGDYGADIVVSLAYGERICVQCKRIQGNVGIDAIQEVVASKKHYKAKRSMVITNSHFTDNAKNLGLSNKVLLIDREKLIHLIELKLANMKNIENGEQWNVFVEEMEK